MANVEAQRQLTRTAAGGSARAAGSIVRSTVVLYEAGLEGVVLACRRRKLAATAVADRDARPCGWCSRPARWHAAVPSDRPGRQRLSDPAAQHRRRNSQRRGEAPRCGRPQELRSCRAPFSEPTRRSCSAKHQPAVSLRALPRYSFSGRPRRQRLPGSAARHRQRYNPRRSEAPWCGQPQALRHCRAPFSGPTRRPCFARDQPAVSQCALPRCASTGRRQKSGSSSFSA